METHDINTSAALAGAALGEMYDAVRFGNYANRGMQAESDFAAALASAMEQAFPQNGTARMWAFVLAHGIVRGMLEAIAEDVRKSDDRQARWVAERAAKANGEVQP